MQQSLGMTLSLISILNGITNSVILSYSINESLADKDQQQNGLTIRMAVNPTLYLVTPFWPEVITVHGSYMLRFCSE